MNLIKLPKPLTISKAYQLQENLERYVDLFENSVSDLCTIFPKALKVLRKIKIIKHTVSQIVIIRLGNAAPTLNE